MSRPTTLLSKLHQAMHALHGVPDHERHLALNHPRRPAADHPRHPSLNHPARQPRVLKTWQRWIAARLGQPLP